MLTLLKSKKYPINWVFTAGYFNIHADLKQMLLTTPTNHSTVITASSHANGFYQSKGPSGMLPDAYTYLSYKFLKSVPSNQGITLREWKNGIVTEANGWSYHAKGVWLLNDDLIPYCTVIGSSNYTRRSYSLDLESNCVILSDDNELRRSMRGELDKLLSHTEEVTVKDFENEDDRHVSWKVKLATGIFGKRL